MSDRNAKQSIFSSGIFLGLWLLLSLIFYFIAPTDLFPHRSFSTVLLDNNDAFLSANVSKDEQWHFPGGTPISDKYKTAAIHFEDRRFYKHNGFDLIAFIRAVKENVSQGKIVSGASTLTMQLMRMHRNNPPRNVIEKTREIILAQSFELHYSKEEIFEFYAQQAPYGGNVIGIEAASWRFFGKSAENLSWAEAALLAVLPNSPGLLHTEKNRDKLQAKRDKLLLSLLENKLIKTATYESAKAEIIPRRPRKIANIAPHLLQFLQKTKGPKLYKTTLDQKTQEKCLDIAQVQGSLLKQNNIDNLAILVLDIEQNKTIAYVGNLKNTGSENQEAVDIIRANRSTGSLLKPFLYAAAINEGLILEKSFLVDYPVQMNGFVAENYHKKHDGLVPANRALIRSLNIPFAHLLQQYGIERFRGILQSYGMSNINKSAEHYGIPLILGGAESSLWDITNAYGILAKTLLTYQHNDGYYAPTDFNATAILRSADIKPTKTQADPIRLRAESIWTTLDNIRQVERPNEQGNWKMYHSNRTIAWKTGTSNGFKDAWAVGVNGKYAIGVWVGNADGEGRAGIIGSKAAAPIFFRVLNSLPDHKWFDQPIDDMQEMPICATSGQLANNYCPVDTQWVSRNVHELPLCKNHQQIYVDNTEKYEVNAQCYNIEDAKTLNIFKIGGKAAYYYQRSSFYSEPPSIHPSCIEASTALKPKIIYPESGLKIYLPRLDEDTRGDFILKAFHNAKKGPLHWHIDENYFGSTSKIHEIKTQLQAGKHKVIVLDEQGNEDVVVFEIVE